MISTTPPRDQRVNQDMTAWPVFRVNKYLTHGSIRVIVLVDENKQYITETRAAS